MIQGLQTVKQAAGEGGEQTVKEGGEQAAEKRKEQAAVEKGKQSLWATPLLWLLRPRHQRHFHRYLYLKGRDAGQIGAAMARQGPKCQLGSFSCSQTASRSTCTSETPCDFDESSYHNRGRGGRS